MSRYPPVTLKVYNIKGCDSTTAASKEYYDEYSTPAQHLVVSLSMGDISVLNEAQNHLRANNFHYDSESLLFHSRPFVEEALKTGCIPPVLSLRHPQTAPEVYRRLRIMHHNSKNPSALLFSQGLEVDFDKYIKNMNWYDDIYHKLNDIDPSLFPRDLPDAPQQETKSNTMSEMVVLAGVDITPAMMTAFVKSRVTYMTVIVQSRCNIDDDDLSALCKSQHLEFLSIKAMYGDSLIKGPGLRHLMRVPTLRELHLPNLRGISESDLVKVFMCHLLEKLSLGTIDAPEYAFKYLSSLDLLTHLQLSEDTTDFRVSHVPPSLENFTVNSELITAIPDTLTSVHTLNINGCINLQLPVPVNDKIPGLPSLRHLYASRCEHVSRIISKVSGLQTLDISRTTLPSLPARSPLVTFNMRGCTISAHKSIVYLSTLKTLEQLDVSSMILPKTIDLSKLTNLKYLYASRTNITRENLLTLIKSRSPLKHIDLSGTSLDANTLTRIATIPTLKSLILDDCTVSPEFLKSLKGQPYSELSFIGCPPRAFTPDLIRDIQARTLRLPDEYIQFERPRHVQRLGLI